MKSLISLFIVLILLNGCETLKTDWIEAKKINNEYAYNNFIRKYPKSKHASDAKKKIDNIHWGKAKQNDNIKSYYSYLKLHPAGVNKKIARQKIEQLKEAKKLRIKEIKRRKEFEKKKAQRHKSTNTLWEAARYGDIKNMELHLSNGANVNAKNKSGSTPLYVAVSGSRVDRNAELYKDDDHLAVIKKLIAQGANVNAKNNDGDTPIRWTNKFDITEVLIRNSADVNAVNKRGRSVLMQVIYSTKNAEDYFKIVDLLLSSGARLNFRDKDRRTSLMQSVSYKDSYKVAKLLLEKGAKINLKDKHGETALMKAREWSVIKLLIEHGANIKDKDRRWRSVFYHLAKNVNMSGRNVKQYSDKDKNEYYRTLSDVGINPTIHEAAEYGLLGYVKEYILKGGNPDAVSKDSRKSTALNFAVVNGHTEIVRALVEAGANINLEDKWHTLPIENAVHDIVGWNEKFIRKKRNGMGNARLWHREIFEILLEKDPIVRPRKLLKNALLSNSPELLDFIESTWNVCTYSDDDYYVYSAVVRGALDSLKWLLDRGVEVNQPQTNSFTAMHVAARNGNMKAVEMLLAAGASKSLKIKAKNGKTPYDDDFYRVLRSSMRHAKKTIKQKNISLIYAYVDSNDRLLMSGNGRYKDQRNKKQKFNYHVGNTISFGENCATIKYPSITRSFRIDKKSKVCFDKNRYQSEKYPGVTITTANGSDKVIGLYGERLYFEPTKLLIEPVPLNCKK